MGRLSLLGRGEAQMAKWNCLCRTGEEKDFAKKKVRKKTPLKKDLLALQSIITGSCYSSEIWLSFVR
jgi:hypothetical protein